MLLMRRIHQRDWAFTCARSQLIQELGVLVYLFGIAATKFVLASRIVTKPFAEFGARSYVLHPLNR